VLSSPKHGPEEIAVVETMKAHTFNVMGSMRSYWDFNMGYGLTVTISLFVQALLFWQLGTMAKTNAAWTRPILALFFFQLHGHDGRSLALFLHRPGCHRIDHRGLPGCRIPYRRDGFHLAP
jgi:hypothetical protein